VLKYGGAPNAGSRVPDAFGGKEDGGIAGDEVMGGEDGVAVP
jgi:hypothetical protein